MASIVDALVVTLGLDISSYKRSQAEARTASKQTTTEVTRGAKEMDERNKQAAESFRKVRNEVLALLAIFTAGMGIKDFIANTVSSSIATGQLARDLGVVPGKLQAVEQAFDRMGASTADADDALKGIQEQAAKLKNGQLDDRLNAYLLNASRAGVKANVNDVDDPIKKLQQDAEIAQRLAATQGRGFAILALQQEGYTRGMADALMQGPKALQGEVARQEKLNQLSQDEADRLRGISNKWKDFKEGMELTGSRIVIALEPAMNVLLNLFNRLSDWFAAHADEIGAKVKDISDRFAAWVNTIDWDKVTEQIKAFFAAIDSTVQSLGGWKTVLIAIAGLKLLSMSSGILGIASAFASLGGALSAVATAGGAALPVLARLLGAAGLMLHSEGLNENEQRTTQPGDKWDGDPVGQRRAAANSGSLQERQNYLATKLEGAGYSKAQAAGIIGSLMQESNLESGIINQSSGAAGIAQWLGPRARAFQSQYGHSVDEGSFSEQVDFMISELKGSEKLADSRIRMAKTPEQAAEIHAREYERPGAAEANIAKRQSYANSIYANLGQANAAQIAGQPTGVAASTPSVNNSSSTSTSSAETHFHGDFHINTQATDANGIARDMGGALQRHQFTLANANTGMS